MVAAKRKAALKPVAHEDAAALNRPRDAALAALDALEQIDALPQVKQQIRKQTLAARDALKEIWQVILSMRLSEYFDPHVHATLHVEHSARKRDAQRKATEARAKKRKKEPTEHPLTARALELYSHYKLRFPKDWLSAEDNTARDLGITLSELRKKILTPARDAGHLPRFNAKPEKTAQSR